ncbi:hypothetical protein ADM96_19495 [Burkholderia sp. ST111]|nr:hypothetical protein ADM96_19495 [Burkholderia sp. ST111]
MLSEQEKELAKFVEAGCSFDNVEALVAAYSPQLVTGGRCVIWVPLTSILSLLKWAPNSALWISITLGADMVLGILIPADPDRPAARYYFSFVEEDGLDVIRRHMPNIKSVDDVAELEEKADRAGFEARLQTYAQANRSDSRALQDQFSEGRATSTVVKKTHVLDTGGHCLVCNAEAGSRFLTTTIGSPEGATSLVVTLCDAHQNEAAGQYLIEFLSKQFDFGLPIKIVNAESAHVLKWIEAALIALDCGNLKPDSKKCQITGTRRSGFKVILRCEGHTEKQSYAYMILAPSGDNLGRIDDAKDHPEQEIRWDHLHLGLPRDNKSVAPSFTFGQPNLDLPAIRREIEKAEAKWRA